MWSEKKVEGHWVVLPIHYLGLNIKSTYGESGPNKRWKDTWVVLLVHFLGQKSRQPIVWWVNVQTKWKINVRKVK